MKRIKIITFGCRTNLYESTLFENFFIENGFHIVRKNFNADIFIINSCSVTKKAEREVLSTLRKCQKNNENAQIIVTGCLDEKLVKDFKNINFFSNKNKEKIFEFLVKKEKLEKIYLKKYFLNTRAFVKIQDGCNSFCSYCIIPFYRNVLKSREKEDVLEEINALAKNGHKEIVLTGINIGLFQNDNYFLKDLIFDISKMKEIKRIRISSINPEHVSKEVMDIILNEEKCCKSMHISLQSGSDKVLKLMRRKYNSSRFLEIVKYLKDKNEDFTITTDIIVGFPNETDKDFEKTIEIVKLAKFLKVHIFPYSERQNTKAKYFENKIAIDVINFRKKMLEKISNEIAFNFREKYLETFLEILVEKDGFGYTDNFMRVKISENSLKNTYQSVKIIKNEKDYLLGKL